MKNVLVLLTTDAAYNRLLVVTYFRSREIELQEMKAKNNRFDRREWCTTPLGISLQTKIIETILFYPKNIRYGLESMPNISFAESEL